jgi:flagellar hook-basal body complex protein FliE
MAYPGWTRAGAPGSTPFGALISSGLQQVNDNLLASEAGMRDLAAGGVENMHRSMIRLEEARLSFQLMVQVRNRLLESYQELMRMQV